MTAYSELLEFWFGELDSDGRADAAHVQCWWSKDEAFDDLVRARFLAAHEAVSAGDHEGWLDEPRGRLAYVVALDQLPRNMFRGSERMFATDAQALAAAEAGLEAGQDRGLGIDERAFLLMPFMHSEELSVQERGIELFTAIRDELEGDARERIAANLGFAVKHRDIVARFGRFPHRNALLGRASTPEELDFLTQPGSSF